MIWAADTAQNTESLIIEVAYLIQIFNIYLKILYFYWILENMKTGWDIPTIMYQSRLQSFEVFFKGHRSHTYLILVLFYVWYCHSAMKICKAIIKIILLQRIKHSCFIFLFLFLVSTRANLIMNVKKGKCVKLYIYICICRQILKIESKSPKS